VYFAARRFWRRCRVTGKLIPGEPARSAAWLAGFGVGLFDTMAQMYPEHAEPLKACAAMEQFNVDYCASFAEDAGVHISEKRADELRKRGEHFARKHDFAHVAKTAIRETPMADRLYAHLARRAGTAELKTLGDDLVNHENALRDWLRSVLDGESDGGEKIFAYLERHGITRQQVLNRPPRSAT